MNMDRSALSGATREVASWIANLRYEHLPARTREVARCAILDTLGCGVYGYQTPWAQMLLKWARAGESKADATVWALGLAGTQGAGVWAFNADGAMSKRLHAGKAAHSGVLAAELAELGFTGPTQIYEFEDGGVLKAFSDASDVAPLTAQLGHVYHLDSTSIKPYSCCGSTHSYVDAALGLRSKLGTPWDPQRPVRVGLAKVVDVQCGFDYVPSTALNAQMSMRYVVAAALMEGQALPPQFSD